MIGGINTNRRRVLRTLVCCGLGALPGLLGTGQHRFRTDDRLLLSLADFFKSRESAIKIGQAYLRNAPAEADVNRLIELVSLSQPEHRLELAHAQVARRRELLVRQQREDFRCGRIVKVEGWILSETEARLCALAALA